MLARLALVIMFAILGSNAVSAKDKEVTAQFSEHSPGSQVQVDHGLWQAFLDQNVALGQQGITLVAYDGVSAESRDALDAYLIQLSKVDPTLLDRAEQFAYWVNLYNALTVKIVLDAYPVKSIRRIKLGRVIALGPWGQNIFMVGEQPVSLDNIEHDILRAIWRDPRIHYAVNCASIGCPNLALSAYTADNAEEMLEAAARAYINHPRGVTVTEKGLVLSRIYKWFRADFGGTEAGVIEHIRIYASDELLAALNGDLPVDGYAYDWSLNEVGAEEN